jgi:hypothetical protein
MNTTTTGKSASKAKRQDFTDPSVTHLVYEPIEAWDAANHNSFPVTKELNLKRRSFCETFLYHHRRPGSSHGYAKLRSSITLFFPATSYLE